jgi:acetylornithine deacetylase/succinyl-diaminopimelate desuccinylase-like protein
MPNFRRRIFLPTSFLLALSARGGEPIVNWDKAKAETLLHYQSIVRMNTSNPPGNETLVVNYLKNIFDREGISYQVFALEPNRANLVARLKGNGRKKPVLILGHTDTVGVQPEMWPVDPFSAVLKDGYIWGSGTTDNKDCVAAGLMLMLELKRLRVPLDRDVIYVAEASEESSSGPIRVGIDYLIKEHWADIEAEYALAEGGFVHSEKGQVRFVEIAATEKVARRAKLIATGTSGHGSRPRRDNAIVHLSTAVSMIANCEPRMRLNDVTRTFFYSLSIYVLNK